MIAPPPRSTISGAAYFMPSAGPRTSTSKIQLHFSASISAIARMPSEMPALLKRMSSPPNSEAASPTAPAMSPSTVTSQRM